MLELETDYFTIVSKPDYISVTCPYCGHQFTDDIGSYIWEELWDNCERAECPECENQFRLVGAEYD